MSPDPRLLVITPDFPPKVGGIQLLVARLVDNLEGFDIRLIAPPGGDHPFLAPAVKRVPPAMWPRLAHRNEVALLNGCAVAEALRSRPDLVLNMHLATSPAALMIRRATGVPYVQYAYAKEIPAKPHLARIALRHASRVVAISSYCRDLLEQNGAGADSIRLVTPGVDVPTDIAPRVDVGPRVLTIGRLQDRYKGHDTLIRAMPLLRAKVPNVRCRIVGDGPLLEPLRALAQVVGAEAYVDFLGGVSDEIRDDELTKATVFCMPSRLPSSGAGEGFGIVYLEAGVHGVPSVAAGVGGSIDAVSDGETGTLIGHPSDHVELAAALTKLIDDRELNLSMGQQAKTHAGKATWQRMAACVGDVCHELL